MWWRPEAVDPALPALWEWRQAIVEAGAARDPVNRRRKP